MNLYWAQNQELKNHGSWNDFEIELEKINEFSLC